MAATAERPVAFGGSHGYQDLVLWLKRVFMPADPNEVARAEHLYAPVFGFALVVFEINVELSMRIDPYQLGHGRFDGNSNSVVVASRFAVVRKRGGGNQQNTHCQ